MSHILQDAPHHVLVIKNSKTMQVSDVILGLLDVQIGQQNQILEPTHGMHARGVNICLVDDNGHLNSSSVNLQDNTHCCFVIFVENICE